MAVAGGAAVILQTGKPVRRPAKSKQEEMEEVELQNEKD